MTRILVVDDERDVREVVRTTLQENGYQVLEAADGVEAYAAVADAAVAEKPDLIVLDLMLPKMNGFEVLEKLKENHQTSYIPVVILTARGQAQDEARALRLGATDYMTKPWSPTSCPIGSVSHWINAGTPSPTHLSLLSESRLQTGGARLESSPRLQTELGSTPLTPV